MKEGVSLGLTLVKAMATPEAGKPARQTVGKRSGKYEMKGFFGVMGNGWSNNGTRRRAQGAKLKLTKPHWAKVRNMSLGAVRQKHDG